MCAVYSFLKDRGERLETCVVKATYDEMTAALPLDKGTIQRSVVKLIALQYIERVNKFTYKVNPPNGTKEASPSESV